MVSMYRWDPAIAATLIEQEHITSFIAPAAMTGDLVQHAQAAPWTSALYYQSVVVALLERRLMAVNQ